MVMRTRRTLALGFAALLLAGCGADTVASEVSSVGVPAPDTAASAGPSTAAELIGGGRIDPVALSETTPVALWFWAPG